MWRKMPSLQESWWKDTSTGWKSRALMQISESSSLKQKLNTLSLLTGLPLELLESAMLSELTLIPESTPSSTTKHVPPSTTPSLTSTNNPECICSCKDLTDQQLFRTAFGIYCEKCREQHVQSLLSTSEKKSMSENKNSDTSSNASQVLSEIFFLCEKLLTEAKATEVSVTLDLPGIAVGSVRIELFAQ